MRRLWLFSGEALSINKALRWCGLSSASIMITYEPLGEMEVESGCGTPVGLATRHVNFIGHERRGAIKFANGVDYHVKTIVFRVLYQYLHSEQHCRVRTKILETTSNQHGCFVT